MISNYYKRLGYYLSDKPSSISDKVRLWKSNSPNTLSLVSQKIYDYDTNTIERCNGNKKSSIPMMNQVNKGLTLDFFVSEGDFLLAGKQKDGEILEITEKKMFPETKESLEKLGCLAKRYCLKLLKKTGLSLAELSKLGKLK